MAAISDMVKSIEVACYMDTHHAEMLTPVEQHHSMQLLKMTVPCENWVW